MAALKQPTIRVVAIIAEGVPESDTKQLIGYARANNKVRSKWIIQGKRVWQEIHKHLHIIGI